MSGEDVISRAEQAVEKLLAGDLNLVPPGTDVFPGEPLAQIVSDALEAQSLSRDLAEAASVVFSRTEDLVNLSVQLSSAGTKVAAARGTNDAQTVAAGEGLLRDGAAVLAVESAGLREVVKRLGQITSDLEGSLASLAMECQSKDA